MRLTSVALSIAGLAALGGCDGAPTGVTPPTVSRGWVVGAAAAALGPDGRFVLPGPASPGPLEIGEQEARAQAVAWARLVATLPTDGGGRNSYTSALIDGYGGPIPFAALRDCDRAFYAESAFGPIPDGAARHVFNGFGPHWVVRLCGPAGDVPVVLTVAATSDLVVSDGQLQPPPPNSGNWFTSMSFRRGTPLARALPLEPEAAVEMVYRATGRRVSEVPVLVQRTIGVPAQPITTPCGQWRVTLEAPLRVVGTASLTQYETRELYVWPPTCALGDTTIYVPLATQPDTALHLRYEIFSDTGGVARIDSVRVPVRTPFLFEPVRASRK